MSLYTIRPATDAERARAAASWRTMLGQPNPPKPDGRPRQGSRLPGRIRVWKCRVSRGWLAKALAEQVDKTIAKAVVLVADHPNAPGLALGWIAYEPEPYTVHALHVESHARRQWVGRELLRHVMTEHGTMPRCTVDNDEGRRLLEHVRDGLLPAVDPEAMKVIGEGAAA